VRSFLFAPLPFPAAMTDCISFQKTVKGGMTDGNFFAAPKNFFQKMAILISSLPFSFVEGSERGNHHPLSRTRKEVRT